MKYKNKIQVAREKYLKRSSLSDQEKVLIEKDFSGKDYSFYQEKDMPFILPEKYRAEVTYSIIEDQINKNISRNRKPLIKYVGYAAAIIVIAFLSTVIYNYSHQSVTMLYASTSYGEKKEISLPDGSTVILNSLSSISYPKEMNSKTRNVTLQGEAYFDIAKNPNQAFIVKAEDIEVKVLGTKFNINAYENQENITTTLFEGSISVGTNSRNIKKLKPGEQAIFSKTTEKFETRTLTNANIESAWRDNMLVFDNIELSDILKTLSRQYNITFEVEDKQFEQLRITARFITNESVEDILRTLGKSAEFTYIKENNNYKIKSIK